MTILPHATIGAVVGAFLPNVPSAIGVGILSHMALDRIPHFDPNLEIQKLTIWRKMFYLILFLIDLSLGILILLWVKEYPTMWWGALAGAATDLDNFLHLLEKIGLKTHIKGAGWHIQTNIFFGLTNQALVTAAGLLLMYLQIGLPFWLPLAV